MTNEIAIRQQSGVVNFEDYAMGVESVVRQVALIQNVMEKIMKEGEHYGKIPGTNKPSLLKPGAEKLCLTFRLDPDYEIIREVRDKDFIAYTVKCTLNHIPTGQRIASGIGSCNSREAKYRYRSIDEMTDTPVPSAYWNAKNAGNSQEMKRLLGEGNRAKKNEQTGKWVIAKSEKVENDNPWDLDNTLVKMACKRALVAAVLNGTAASDIFTQDVEDLPSEYLGQKQTPNKKDRVKYEEPVEVVEAAPVAEEDAPPFDEPFEDAPAPPKPISEAQQKRLFARAKASGWPTAELKAYLIEVHGITSTKDIPLERYDKIIEWIDTHDGYTPKEDAA